MHATNGLFREQIKIDNNATLKKGPIRSYLKVIIWILIIAAFIGSIFIINFSFAKNGWSLFFKNWKDFFSPSSFSNLYKENLFLISIKFLWNSVKIVFLSTTLGLFFAFITSYFANYKTNSKYIAIPVKILVIFLRIFPELFFIYLFKVSFDKTLSIHFILTWFTWLWLHEYFSQTIENANFNIFYHLVKIRNSKFKAFWIEIWPQIKRKIIGFFFYAFESNLRWATILAQLGYLGIGILTNPQQEPIEFNQILIPLLILVIFLVIVEIISQNINKLFFESKTINEINHKKYKDKKIIKRFFGWLLIISALVICGFGIASLVGQKFYASEVSNYFKQMFQANWSQVHLDLSQDGIFYILLQLGALVFVTWVLIYIISYFRILIMTKSLVGSKISTIIKYTNMFIRAMPVVTIFLLFSNLFNVYAAGFVVAFAIHGVTSLSRNLAQATNAISTEKIYELKKMNYSNFWIYRHYIRPLVRLDFITLGSFQIEKTIRNFITFGSLSSSLLGEQATLNKVKKISDIAPYLWIGMIIIAVVNLVAYLIRVKFTKQKWI
ncbi:ABC transporter permease [Metamycoplasma phocicerebrale]|uniref:ABC transporter permease n=1 Tax=Metamycoplasma phocicerebrale TaxID=142649 RepID=A0A3T0TUW0_9BACT|nr:ABC transporter permease [Metamycoplasma phocicerebrale]AZZ65796.1 ABC transporter permease [Metamycoplasma phocicerebrale]